MEEVAGRRGIRGVSILGFQWVSRSWQTSGVHFSQGGKREHGKSLLTAYHEGTGGAASWKDFTPGCRPRVPRLCGGPELALRNGISASVKTFPFFKTFSALNLSTPHV